MMFLQSAFFFLSQGIQIEYVLSFSFPDGIWVLSTRDTDSDRGSILRGKCRRESQEREEGCSPQFEPVFVRFRAAAAVVMAMVVVIS